MATASVLGISWYCLRVLLLTALPKSGPTSGVAASYIPAVIQSMANLLGHQPGSHKKCATRGKIICVVKFGAKDIDYNSYV